MRAAKQLPPPPAVRDRALELGVYGVEQLLDIGAQHLVPDEHHDRDGAENQRVLGHRLALASLTHLDVQPGQKLHSRVLLAIFLGHYWPLSPM